MSALLANMRASTRLLQATQARGLDEFIAQSFNAARKSRIDAAPTAVAQYNEMARFSLERQFSEAPETVSTALDAKQIGARWFANAEFGVSPKYDVAYNADTPALLRRLPRFVAQGEQLPSGYITKVARVSVKPGTRSPAVVSISSETDAVTEAHERLLSSTVGGLNIAVPKKSRTVDALNAARLSRDVAHSVSHAPTVFINDGIVGGGSPGDKRVAGVRVVAASDNAVSALALNHLLFRTPSSLASDLEGPAFAAADGAGARKHMGGSTVHVTVAGGYALESDAHAKEFGGPLAGRHLELSSPHFTLHTFAEGKDGSWDSGVVVAATSSITELASAIGHAAAVALATSGRGVVVPGVLIGGPDGSATLHLTKAGTVPADAAASPYFLGGPFVVISAAGVSPLFAGTVVKTTDAAALAEFDEGTIHGSDGVAVVGIRCPGYAPRCVPHSAVAVHGNDYDSIADASSSVGYASKDEIEAVLDAIYGTGASVPKTAAKTSALTIEQRLAKFPKRAQAAAPSVLARAK